MLRIYIIIFKIIFLSIFNETLVQRNIQKESSTFLCTFSFKYLMQTNVNRILRIKQIRKQH